MKAQCGNEGYNMQYVTVQTLNSGNEVVCQISHTHAKVGANVKVISVTQNRCMRVCYARGSSGIFSRNVTFETF